MALVIATGGANALKRISDIVQGSSDYTALFWIKITNPTSGFARSYFVQNNGFATYTEWAAIWSEADESNMFVSAESGDGSSDTTKEFLIQSKWYPVAYARDGSAQRFYFDSALIEEVTEDLSATTFIEQWLGNDTYSSGACEILGFREYNKALTLDGLIVEWNSPEFAVDTVNLWADTPLISNGDDISGNNRDWIEVGTPSFVAGPTPLTVDVLPDFEYGAPEDDDGVSLTLPGSSWGYTDLETLIEETDAVCILTGCVARPVGALFTGFAFEVEILVDEVTLIARFRGFLSEVNASVGSEGVKFDTGKIGIDLIPQGSKVSARMRAATTLTPLFHISISYLKKPLSGEMLLTTQPLLCKPVGNDPDFSLSLGALPVVTSATPWTYGTAVELFDDSGPGRAIVGVVGIIQGAGIEWEIGLCITDGDTLITTLAGAANGVSSYPNYISMSHPYTVEELTSILVKSRSQDPFALTLLFSMNYFEMPLS